MSLVAYSCLLRITGEVVTQIAYGAHRDDEHDFVKMNEGEFSPAIMGKYLVNFFPWCASSFMISRIIS